MHKTILVFLIFNLTLGAFAQDKNQIIPKKRVQKSVITFDYLSVNMPEGETNMGLSGIHYNLKINNWFYTGVGMYGSVNGFRGGLFTLGVDMGIRSNLSKNIFLDTGIHLGGGGGSGAPDGGGAFILPHFNLGYQFSYFSLEAGYSYVNFFDKGAINSSQLNIALRIPMSFDYSLFKYADKSFSQRDLSETSWNQKSKKHGFLMRLDNFNLKGRTTDDKGNLITDKTIRLAGFEFDSYFSENSFTYIRADGAYRGIPAGFMDIVLGIGSSLSFNQNRTQILAKFGLGAAGGGGVNIQGGFIINPEIALEQKLFKNTALFVNTGYFLTPNSTFKASTYGIGLKYTTYQGGLLNNDAKSFSHTVFKGIETSVGQEVYFNAQRTDGSVQDLYKILLQINFYLNKTLYIAGQTSFANFGNAGAYAEGVFGMGLSSRSLFKNKVRFFTQILVGGAGGGHISTGQGLIIKPGAGLHYSISDKLALRTTLGRVKAIGSGLNSTYFNLGLSYRLAFLTGRN
jgi:hypothetical protein